MTYLDWIRELGAGHSFGRDDRLGSLGRIDGSARARAAACMTTGASSSIAKPLTEGPSLRHDGRPAYRLESFYSDEPVGVYTDRSVGTGSEHVRLDCHGIDNTHIDALNHTAIDGCWYGGRPVDSDDVPSLIDFAPGIVTRALYVDIAGARGVDWVGADQPVTSSEILDGIRAIGTDLLPGDALLVDMGRDRYEAAGGSVREVTRPGLGEDAARWLATAPVGLVAWDFLDAKHPDEPQASVHMLNWAIGLVLIDNCSFAAVRDIFRQAGGQAALVVAPLPMAGASGGNVSPLVVT